ncbi:AcrB/AcrD/AcrF family protein [Bradyrhizobium lupini HPC(L)]|uniref:AcrB/AcrD/AcrF family protein n=1 Tax=Bradyrhizobium lupini HPC(L) TaxID=1229491 RepID=A0ABN0HQM6_RHILU|nr:AcrB/AcrD/AcrF family protein [Bradyrhizobium lupini HPC(L)]
MTLYITPVSYLLIARFAKPQADEEIRLHRELELAARRKALEEDKPLLAAE